MSTATLDPIRTDLSAAQTPQSPADLLRVGRERGQQAGVIYAGGVYPPEAWALFSAGAAQLVDVRSAEELKFVGHVPGSQHVAWMTGAALLKNPRFIRELEKIASKDSVLLLLCRSGKRSAAAAEAAALAGFTAVYNVLEGFEGELDPLQRRGESGGWRHWGLPWVQD